MNARRTRSVACTSEGIEGEPPRTSQRKGAGFHALVILAFGWIGTSNTLAADAPWRWTVSQISGQQFDTRQQAESALRALGGKYALAEVIENVNSTETHVTYTYGAKPRGPDVGPWYDYTMQSALTNPHPSEAAAIASVIAWGDQNRQSCTGPTTVTAVSDWLVDRYWFNGQSDRERRNHTVGYDIYPACDRGNMPSTLWRKRDIACPAHMSWNGTVGACALNGIATISGDLRPCSGCDKVGNPSSTSTGAKSLRETDLNLGWIRFERHYNSDADVPYAGLGKHWSHSLSVRMMVTPFGTPQGFVNEAGEPLPIKSDETLDGSGERRESGSPGQHRWLRTDGSSKTFNVVGRLLRDDFVDGRSNVYAYDTNGRLTSVTASGGRSLQFVYHPGPASAESQIKEITSGGVVLVSYGYDANGNLTLVTFPDSTTRQYHYEDTNYPNHLTGVTDENASRFATYAYDALGRVLSSEHAGGAGRVELTYEPDGSTHVTDALGKTSIYRFTNDGRYRKPVSVEFGGATESWTFPSPATDFRRRPLERVDRNGRITKYSYAIIADPATGQSLMHTRTTEAFGTPRQRVKDVYRQYTTPLTAKVEESGRTQTFTYNTRRQVVTSATKDTATAEVRTTTRTYCESVDLVAGCPWVGLLNTIDGPRTDVADVTTFTYDAQGSLKTVTNALGHTTTYDTYNAHGQPTQITDANNLLTTLAYDARHRLIQRCVGGTLPGCSGGELTALDYWPTGLLKKVTSPGGSFIEYHYDPAHRLTEIEDSAGNKIVYTLDDAGNRTGEDTYDPSLTLKRTHTQVFNTLSQLWKDVNAAGTAAVTTTFGYDNNGNQTTVASPLSRNSTSTYDELNRLNQITDPASGVTAFGYDANDNLTQVTDPRSLVTSYTYNGFGDLKTQVSPDTGTTTNTYDSGGNLDTSTDSRGAVADYAYDALNRVTSVSYTLGGVTDQTIAYTYDSGTNQKGHLTGATDANHTLSWTYDAQGRVTGKGQTVSAITKSIGYGYNADGQLASMVLPSGKTITYGYNANNQITSVTLNSPAVTILNNITYDPFGPITGWTWGNSTTATRTFDTDGKLTAINGQEQKTFGYDDAFRITGVTDAADSTKSWTLGYDVLDRLNVATKTSTTIGYTYDANGNRLSQTGTSASTYTMSGSSNKLTSTSGALTRGYSYDAVGNTIASGATVHSYNNANRMKTGRLASGSDTTYVYNALGQRVKKSGGAIVSPIYFMYDEAGHLVGEYDSSGNLIQETVWLGDIPVATLRPNGAIVDVFYVHTDQLNTPRKVSRPSDNALRWRWDPTPFGEGAPDQNPASIGSFVYNLRFPGQQFDAETNLNYNYFRDYDPATGRYVESDPIGLKGGTNTFSYALQEPILHFDPTGLTTYEGYVRCLAERAAGDYSRNCTWQLFASAVEIEKFAANCGAVGNGVVCAATCTAKQIVGDGVWGVAINAHKLAATTVLERIAKEAAEEGVRRGATSVLLIDRVYDVVGATICTVKCVKQ
jgi:RHS repeat-associated protein